MYSLTPFLSRTNRSDFIPRDLQQLSLRHFLHLPSQPRQHRQLNRGSRPITRKEVQAKDSLLSRRTIVFMHTPVRRIQFLPVSALTLSSENPLQIAVLNLFCSLKARFPNLVIGSVTRESVRRALLNGITADQVCSWLIERDPSH
jgi:hypothetical protein